MKRPPIPPELPPLPAVGDLRITRGPQGVWLTWSMPDPLPVDPERLSGFAIYRFKKDAADPCEDCPAIFERHAQVPAAFRRDGETGPPVFSFQERLETGFSYTYKVNLMDIDGREGPDSNRVTIVF